MRREKEGSDEAGGLTGNRLVASSFRALQAARRGAGMEVVEFDDLDGGVQEALPALVGEIENAFASAEEAGDDVSLPSMAEHYARRLVALVSGEIIAEIPARDRFVFEALVRHVANCMDYDPDDHGEMEAHEEGWEQWVRDRLRAAGLAP